MTKQARIVLLSAMVATISLLGTSCWQGGEPASPEPGELVIPEDFDWDFQQTVSVQLEVAESARPMSGTSRVEVRHSYDGGSLIFAGGLNDENGWRHAFRTRVPKGESELTMTVETARGLVRHRAPIRPGGVVQIVFD